MTLKFIDQIDLTGKTVLIRGDLDVPLDEKKNVTDDTRLKGLVPSIEYALKQNAKVLILGHAGRPKGTKKPEFSLKPMATRLGILLKKEVRLAPDCIGPAVVDAIGALPPGGGLMLENVRFYAEEEQNDPAFGRELAGLCDVYINDAFATSHRAHASVEAAARAATVKAGGFTLKRELEFFSKALENPARPLIAIFGGAKVSTKLGAIRNVGKRANKILIGGAMANTFFAAQGHGVGKSLFESELLDTAIEIEDELKKSGCQLVLPIDVVIAKALKPDLPIQAVSIDQIPSDQMALDIGPKSRLHFAQELKGAATIVWNGPMGAFETHNFQTGTFFIIDELARSKALTVVGGGDTDAALHMKHAFDKMGYVSTAGGAFLQLLEGLPLPAVEALKA